MAVNKYAGNKVLNGIFGRLWINGEDRANIKSFEAKATLNWEEVNVADELGKQQKYMGYEGAGTMVFSKYDSYISKLMSEGIATGVMPEISVVGRLSDPEAYGSERVELIGVTFDEITLLKFASKELGEEEVPFKFSGFKFLDTI